MSLQNNQLGYGSIPQKIVH